MVLSLIRFTHIISSKYNKIILLLRRLKLYGNKAIFNDVEKNIKKLKTKI
jgi:hypothetical protein